MYIKGFIGIAVFPFFGFIATYAAIKLNDSYLMVKNQNILNDDERNQYGVILKESYGKYLRFFLKFF